MTTQSNSDSQTGGAVTNKSSQQKDPPHARETNRRDRNPNPLFDAPRQFGLLLEYLLPSSPELDGGDRHAPAPVSA